jgi:hypothetical protein
MENTEPTKAPEQNRRASDSKPEQRPDNAGQVRSVARQVAQDNAAGKDRERMDTKMVDAPRPNPPAPAPTVVKVPAVEMHITPPSDSKQPTEVHLPSAHPDKPAVTVKITPNAAAAPRPATTGYMAPAAPSPIKAKLTELEKILMGGMLALFVFEVAKNFTAIRAAFGF